MNMRYTLLILVIASLATPSLPTLSASVYMGSATVTDSDSAESDTVYGSADYTNTRRTGLSVGGSLRFTSLSVDGPIDVAGRASGRDLTCGPLTIRGALTDAAQVNCSACSVSGSCTVDTMTCDSLSVHGKLTATHLTARNELTVFGYAHTADSALGSVTLYAGEALFSNTTLKNLTVKKSDEILSNWFGWFGSLLKLFFTPEKKRPIITLTGTTAITGDIFFEGGDGIVKCSPTVHIGGSVIGGTIERAS